MIGISFHLNAQFDKGWLMDEIEHAMDSVRCLPANNRPAFVSGNETAKPRLMYRN